MTEVESRNNAMIAASRCVEAALREENMLTVAALLRAAARYVERVGVEKAHDGEVVAFPNAHALEGLGLARVW